MGRSSVNQQIVTVFGATGFVGRYLVNRLGGAGHQVIIPFRGNESDYSHLKPMGDLGKIVPMRFHLKDRESIRDAVKHANVVINLIGQDRPSRNFTIRQANVEGAERIAEVCAEESSVQRMIHLSSLLSRSDVASPVLQSQAEAEGLVKARLGEKAVIVRAASIFGNEDRFLNAIGKFASLSLGYPVLDQGSQRRTPIYVGDVAEALLRLTKLEVAAGRTVNLYGPKTWVMRELIDYFSRITMRPHRLLNLPPWALWLYGRCSIEWKRPLFTRDAIAQMAITEERLSWAPHLASGEVPLVASDLGLARLHSVEEMALSCLRGFRTPDDFTRTFD